MTCRPFASSNEQQSRPKLEPNNTPVVRADDLLAAICQQQEALHFDSRELVPLIEQIADTVVRRRESCPAWWYPIRP